MSEPPKSARAKRIEHTIAANNAQIQDIKKKLLLIKQHPKVSRKKSTEKPSDEGPKESESATFCGHTSRYVILVLLFWTMVALFAVIIMMGFTALGQWENGVIQG